MNKFKSKTIRDVLINGYRISVSKVWNAACQSEADAGFFVEEGNPYDDEDYGDEMDFETEAEAIAYFERRCEELRDTPNWEAQADYDDRHGTINGEDPGIVHMRELGF